MKNAKLLAEKKVIDNLFTEIENFIGDPYIKSLLTYYLCIRISGFLENSIRIIYTDYSNPNAKGNVFTFVGNKLKKFPNPTWSAILNLANDFDPNWKANIKNNIKPNQLTSLESINVNKNAIAHGGSSNITLSDLHSYYNDMVMLIDDVECICT